MKTNFQAKLEKLFAFYNKDVGDRIKKRRLELGLTQEMLAKKICSNTYVSKIENNKVSVNDEYLGLIMEKMDLEPKDILVPEEVIEYLYKALTCFFYKNIDEYAEIINTLKMYESNVLVFIIRLGYYVLTENYEEARIYNDELYRYTNNLEEFGFAIFCLFSGYYYVGVRDFKRAREIVEVTESKLVNDYYQLGLFNFLAFIIYGHLYKFSKGSVYKNIAFDIFRNKSNFNRLSELSMYSNLFSIFEDSNVNVENLSGQLSLLSDSQKNMYMFTLSLSDLDSDKVEQYLDESSMYYLLYKAISAFRAFLRKDMLKYREEKAYLKLKQFDYEKKIDFFHLLVSLENKDYHIVKEQLIKEFLPVADKFQNIYLYLWLKKYVCKLYEYVNRYKMSTQFAELIDKRIEKLQ